MKIGGFQKFTLSDFPSRIASIVFTQGCNFRCPFCHNGNLIPMDRCEEELVPEDYVLAYLERRIDQLEGVVVTGGEPTIQPDLGLFLQRIRKMGFRIKLDTNGSRPEALETLFGQGLVDYVAMDIKAPFMGYSALTGGAAPVEKIRESMRLVSKSGINHHFRTTLVPGLLTETDLEYIPSMVPEGSAHCFQSFQPANALDPALRQTGGRTSDPGR